MEHRAQQPRGARGTRHRALPGQAPPRSAHSRSSHSPGPESHSPLALLQDVDAPICGLCTRPIFPGFLARLRRLTPDPRLRLVRLREGRGRDVDGQPRKQGAVPGGEDKELALPQGSCALVTMHVPHSGPRAGPLWRLKY